MSNNSEKSSAQHYRHSDGLVFLFLTRHSAQSDEIEYEKDRIKKCIYFWHSETADEDWKSYLIDLAGIVHSTRGDDITGHILSGIKGICQNLFEMTSSSSHTHHLIRERTRHCDRVYSDYPERFGDAATIELIALYLLYYVLKYNSPHHDISETIEIMDSDTFVKWLDKIEDMQDMISEILVLVTNTTSFRVIDFSVSDSTAGLPTAVDLGIKESTIDLSSTEWMVSPRVIGMGYQAQVRSTEWGINYLANHTDLDQTPTYPTQGAKGNLEVAFFIAGEQQLSSSLDKSSGTSPIEIETANKILQRWGPIHARLYLAITMYLSKSNGEQVELSEKQLLKAAGMDSDIRNGNISTIEALDNIEIALNDLKSLHLSVISRDGKYATGRFPVYQIEPLKIRHKVGNAYGISMHVRFAPGLWARDIFRLNGSARALPVSSKVLSIPFKRYPVASALALWISFNSYLFKPTNNITIGDVLRSILPDQKPYAEWRGMSITWQILNPAGRLEQEGKSARASVRKQFSKMPELLIRYGILINMTGHSLRLNSSWEDFLETKIEVEIPKPIRTAPKRNKTDRSRSSDSDLIEPNELRRQIKLAGLTQADVAAHLRVSQPTVSNWLNGRSLIPPDVKDSIQRLCRGQAEKNR